MTLDPFVKIKEFADEFYVVFCKTSVVHSAIAWGFKSRAEAERFVDDGAHIPLVEEARARIKQDIAERGEDARFDEGLRGLRRMMESV